ncbi:uncharacterized protein isoform X2 [Danio rerio]|uniref:Uncharacterized protein isoform X2 n=1 Tax=Danio rerio TaxID=7955 RepID=A0AC58H937_DANRE
MAASSGGGAVQAVGNDWIENGQEWGDGNDGSGNEVEEMEGSESCEPWTNCRGKKRKKRKNKLDSDEEMRSKVKEGNEEYNVFVRLVQEGATFEDWSPIQLTKALYKEIGEMVAVMHQKLVANRHKTHKKKKKKKLSVRVSRRHRRFRVEMAAVRSDSLEYFPENILIDILSYLSVQALVRNSRVCRRWQQLVKDQRLWRCVDLSSLKRHTDQHPDSGSGQRAVVLGPAPAQCVCVAAAEASGAAGSAARDGGGSEELRSPRHTHTADELRSLRHTHPASAHTPGAADGRACADAGAGAGGGLAGAAEAQSGRDGGQSGSAGAGTAAGAAVAAAALMQTRTQHAAQELQVCAAAASAGVQ